MTDKSPPPPDDKSFHKEIERRWRKVIENWEKGYALEEEFKALQYDIEFERKEIFEKKTKPEDFDWEADWHNAKILHEYYLDLMENKKVQLENLADFWAKHFDNLQNVSSMVRVEGSPTGQWRCYDYCGSSSLWPDI
ncbi:hypothetical protein [uncultured Roseibium sp.]|uniref:hypothetical protein n=1 Tax=uncultured Roseibium sp. TaxID=1936171 RepID=UPI0032165383